jgi:CHAT domain-containing protein
MLYQLSSKITLLDSMRLNGVSGIKTVDVYNAALASVDLMLYINQNLNLTGSKTFWLNKEAHQLFEQAIYYAVLVDKEEQNDHYKEEAFLLSEKSRSILLFESLREKSATHFAGIPDSLTDKEKSLKRIFYNLEKKRNNAQIEKDSQLISVYERELLDIKMKMESLNSLFVQKYPAFYQLKYPELKIKPKDIMSKLGDSTVMVEYFQGKQRSFVFVLRNNSFDCHQIVADSTLTNRVLDFQKLVSDLPYAVKSPDEYFGKYSSTALELYNFWLKPFLGPKDKGKRLVIISDGSLSYMPFDALLTQKPETKQANYSNLPYLLRDYTVNYDYSAQLWLQHQQPKPQLNGKILAMAPTYIKKSEDTLALRNRMRSGIERDLRDGITELPGAKLEIKLLKNSYKGFYPTKMNASERVWKKNAADYGIVHFAMHGLIDESEPEFSSLVFAEDGDAQEDNFLYAYEIKQSKLNASLVVLSACETGAGKYQRGEGVMSIGRGFMYAGVPSVVMTLWKLNDQSAAELIGNFYKNLANGMQKDKALQQAKLQYLEASNNNTAHPALWACFMQLGDYSAIKIEKINYFNYLVLAGLLLAALGVLFFYLRKRKYSN